MESIDGVLKEEVRRLQAAQHSYVREIAKLPKGSVQMKKIKGIRYPYLVFRKGKKVIYQYVGYLSERDVKNLEERIDLRRRYEKQLREMRYNQKRIKRMLRGRKQTV